MTHIKPGLDSDKFSFFGTLGKVRTNRSGAFFKKAEQSGLVVFVLERFECQALKELCVSPL
jgi:hypothetical protein